MGTSATGIWIIVIIAVFGLVVWLTGVVVAARSQARRSRQ
jgi:type IV secretory pathway TrbD component